MVLIFIHNVIITNLCSLAEFLPREYQRVKFIDKEIFKVHVCTYIIQFRCKLRNTNILFVSTWYLYMLYSDVVFGCCTSGREVVGPCYKLFFPVTPDKYSTCTNQCGLLKGLEAFLEA